MFDKITIINILIKVREMLDICTINNNTYQKRISQKTDYYKLVETHFEELEGVWDEKYQNTYGFYRPQITDVIYKYLDCGDPKNGFARVKCTKCKYEFLLPFSCKRRYFCPSCHQRRVIEFGENLYMNILKHVKHRQWVFSIPKRIRYYFTHNRKLLSKLSKCAWEVLSEYLQYSVNDQNAKPGVIISIQTFGDFLNPNTHLHVIATDGCFTENGDFITGNIPKGLELEEAFRNKVLYMLKKEGIIHDIVIENMKDWTHSGFNVYCSESVSPYDKEGIEKLAQYIVRSPVSLKRMKYVPFDESDDGVAKVIYQAKNSNLKETFDAIDFLARVIAHTPDKNEHLVRYYGFYSNKSRGIRKKLDTDEKVPSILDSDISRKDFKRNWARLIQKIYKIDPLVCPKCSSPMKIVSFIEDNNIIKKILKHLNLWNIQNNSPPRPSKITQNNDSEPDYCGSQIEYEDDYSQLNPYEDS